MGKTKYIRSQFEVLDHEALCFQDLDKYDCFVFVDEYVEDRSKTSIVLKVGNDEYIRIVNASWYSGLKSIKNHKESGKSLCYKLVQYYPRRKMTIEDMENLL